MPRLALLKLEEPIEPVVFKKALCEQSLIHTAEAVADGCAWAKLQTSAIRMVPR